MTNELSTSQLTIPTITLSKSTGDIVKDVAVDNDIGPTRTGSASGSTTTFKYQFSRQKLRASSLEPDSIFTCSECKFWTSEKSRYDKHFKQPRHVNNYRDLAYKEPKKRQMWLKVWFSKLEAAEAEVDNYGTFEVTEEEEDDFDEDLVFRMPTASDIENAYKSDRKISSSSNCSTMSYQSTYSACSEG